MPVTAEPLKCTDCGEPFTIDSAHDCPGSVLDRLQHLERLTEELNSIIKSMVRVVAYSIREQPIGKAHSEKPPPPLTKGKRK
jgi:hypothetical protein